MIKKDSHTHRFILPKTKKVILSGGAKTAIDVLKFYKCVGCGKERAEDLVERKVI